MTDYTQDQLQTHSPTMRATARAMYEARPDATFDSVAAELDVSTRSVKRWSAADGHWRKAGGPIISARAHEVADRITKAVEETGPDASEESKQAATEAARIEAAVDERAQVLVKHRSEWGVVRGLVAEAVRGRDSAKARLAVDVGRALKFAQDGERRAWGLDVETNPSTTIVIERI